MCTRSRCCVSKAAAGLAVAVLMAGMAVAQDVFSEEALAAWLGPSHLMVHLRFDQATTASRLHLSFPHAMQHLATALPLKSAELHLTAGRWRYGEWGWPLVPAKPVGAVLDASFVASASSPEAGGTSGGGSGSDSGDAGLEAHWSALVAALSGLSCASLSLLREPRSVGEGHTRLQDLEAGRANASGVAGVRRLRALLPHEALCTENLTPWLRLLPCGDQAGLASLLRHRPTVFGAEYVSLGLLLERGAVSEDRPGVRLVQTATFVVRATAPAAGSGGQAKGAESGTGSAAAAARVMLEQALRAEVEHACPPAARSLVFVAEPREEPAAVVAAAPAAPLTPAAAAAGSCSASAGQADGGEGGVAAGSCTSLREAAPAAGEAVEQEGPGVREQPGAGPQGQQLALWAVSAGSTHHGLTAARSPAVPRLQVYDTLDLLDARGWGLHLPLPSPPARPVGAGGGGLGSASGGASGALGPAPVAVERYVTGAGMLRGGMVLAVRRSPQLRERLRVAAAEAGGACAGAAVGGGGAAADGVCLLEVVCVYQVFPWYIRPWLHTLSVLYDGQPVPLQRHLVSRHVRPATARASPGVVDLCLAASPDVSELRLRLDFSKAFLTAFEYPPDAHRGFDVPAALVSYVEPLALPAAQWREGDSGEGQAPASPLLLALQGGAVQQVYTPALLVPLAAPDFSMPYNVICLSSTVLAVYFGATLNLVMRRGAGDTAGADGAAAAGGAAGKAAARRRRLRKAVQAVVLLVAFGALALYLDSELREQAEEWLRGLGLEVGSPKPLLGCQAQGTC
ncbi:hypothetical protein HYH02_006208 [Chlamydomonas schloesseri]|uniref:GPI transamidase component PIG-T n=1 Tax=Chlamydomonas schloesseri TaxID=2026947 RepID=A0A835WJQ7_9CHLO|nr:hypothetical protein HYH02_006208 [Chlamydomonas schloesseri]|eukprot:KAG2448857.1 hypothetical protein HYH02_006208 [Chlamydomonas schloesseri]